MSVIVTDMTGGRKGEGVGVMKDKELKLEEIEASHTRLSTAMLLRR